MPVYAKSTSDDIVLGLAVVGRGADVPAAFDASGAYTVRFVEISGLRSIQALETRYLVGPSGWSA